MNKRGVTILEVILAMAVIMTVSVTAIMIITQFSRVSATMMSRNEVITLSENALETFKFAKSQKEFDQLINMTGSTRFFEKEAYIQQDLNKDENGDYIAPRGSATYTLEDPHYTARVQVVYTPDTALFSVIVVNEHGVSVYSVVNYTKGVDDNA